MQEQYEQEPIQTLIAASERDDEYTRFALRACIHTYSVSVPLSTCIKP